QLLAALVSTQWNKSQAAQQLHWSRMTLYRKLRQYHLTVPRERPPQRPSTHGRGQDKGDVPRSARLPPGTAMGTGGPPHLPSWKLPDALWQRMAAVIQIGRGTRLNSSHVKISYAVFCLKKK